MLSLKMQQIKNQVQDAQNAVNQAYYKAETWARLLAESGNNLTNDEFSRLIDAMQCIIESLEDYRN